MGRVIVSLVAAARSIGRPASAHSAQNPPIKNSWTAKQSGSKWKIGAG